MFKRRVKAIEIASMTVAGLEIVTKSILSPDSKDENYLLPELWGDFWSVFPKLGVKTATLGRICLYKSLINASSERSAGSYLHK
jgi:hypothetical protein